MRLTADVVLSLGITWRNRRRHLTFRELKYLQ